MHNFIGSDIGVPQMARTLNSNSSVCFEVELKTDDLIEETETATLSLELTNDSGITNVDPHVTTIIITDNSCEYLRYIKLNNFVNIPKIFQLLLLDSVNRRMKCMSRLDRTHLLMYVSNSSVELLLLAHMLAIHWNMMIQMLHKVSFKFFFCKSSGIVV